MKCHIAQNGGFMFLILFIWTSVASCSSTTKISTIQEFCSENVYIHNIEIGDTYQLVLRSEPTAAVDKWYQISKRKCLKEYKTSDPAAHFIVDITDMNIPSCSACRCNYFEISVLAYKKKKYCHKAESDSFSSKSDTVSVEFHHAMTMGFNVTLTFRVERNFYIIDGTPSDTGNAGGSYLETPYFPNPYPSNYRAEYLLKSEDPQSHVVLLFLDFQISNHSFIEVDGNTEIIPTRFYGSTFRPPVIVSQSNQLNVKFQSFNELVRPGFRALTSFIRTVDSLSVPYTDCGGLKHGRGGNMNIVTHEKFSLYDCVWHVMLPFISAKMNLSVSVHLRDIGFKSNLEFRNGHYSKSSLLKDINCERDNCTYLYDEMVIPTLSDLYIRFSGYLDVYSEVNISYVTYHTGNCSNHEFTCEDGRCLLLDFRCDGSTQCPGGEDEQHCSTTIPPDVEVSQIPTNVEKSGQNSTIHRNFFILLLVGSFGLVAVLVAVIVLYKHRKAAPANIEQPQPRFGNEMSSVLPTLYPCNPYGNDSPPSYEDFIKSSDIYPPLFFTKANKSMVARYPGRSCTTSFSTAFPTRHLSADSCGRRTSTTDSNPSWSRSRTCTGTSQQTCLNLFGTDASNHSRPVLSTPSSNVRKCYSLDSKLNDLVKEGTCHLFLSIIQPACNHESAHTTRVECHSLPPNFKISTTKCNEEDVIKLKQPVWLPSLSDRRCTWSVIQQPSGSDFLNGVKARCCSDPCKGVHIHYSG